jgi:hypothetical protein
LNTYGITLKQYQEMESLQSGVCAICGRKESAKTNKGTISPLCVDHDHKTGKVRGLLCKNCNSGIGMFQESINVLKVAITYLEKYSVYQKDDYGDKVLYCDTIDTELYYTDDLAFVALPQGTDWMCGDFVVIDFLDGTRIKALALDSGPFKDNCVMHDNGECVPIIVDIPTHLWPYDGAISARATMLNISLLNRMLTDSQVGYLR